MAQFGKHLFGTSFFGKTSTFDGEYETAFVDAYDYFTGTVRVELDALLPFQLYNARDLNVSYGDKTKWTFSGNQATTRALGETVSILACGDVFNLHLKKETGGGTATVTIKNINEETEVVHRVDSSEESMYSYNLPYADYLITVKTDTSNPFTFEGFNIRVANVGVEIRTAKTFVNNQPVWQEFKKVEMDLNGDNPALTGQDKYIGHSPIFTDDRYIQIKLHLATSESLKAPVVDRLHYSSGDLTKHALAGYWEAAINFNNIASDEGKTFKRVKRTQWIETETNNSLSDIRTTSVSTAANTTVIPTRQQLLDASYWKAETAPYILKHNGNSVGVPWSRISLAEAKNGYENSATLGSVMIGPINSKDANLTNTKITRWLNWNDQSFYPTNKQGVNIVYELFENKSDITDGYPPIFRVSSPESIRERIVTLAPEDATEQLFLRIQLQRSSGRQSPVVDFVDISAQMRYESASSIARYSSQLSALDGIDLYGDEGVGRKELETVPHSIYDWPSLTQALPINTQNLLANNRVVKMDYRPRYHNQVQIGIGEELVNERRFRADTTQSFKLFSQVDASVPKASVHQVPANELFWHYSYDGGTVNFPLETKRNLSSQYTPNLLANKKYRFHLRNGWEDEQFKVPFSMTLEEVASISNVNIDELKETNGDIKMYDGKVPMGYTITLPNRSLNDKIHFRFDKTNTLLTESSILNGVANDSVVAWIPRGGDFEYIDWVSDEVTYSGMINPNDSFGSYIRTQYSTANALRESQYQVVKKEEYAKDIAKAFAVNEIDLILANNKRDTYKQGELLVIPGGFTLPEMAPGLIYEGDNPYVVEVIPGSVEKLENSIKLADDVLIPGSDDEEAIQYTLKESPVIDVFVDRGSVRNGEDVIPLSNVMKVTAVKNTETGQRYTPYSNVNGSQMGDYILKGNRIDWSPAHASGKEPAEGETYTVSLTHGIVDSIRIIYTSDYSERMAQDRLWRSTDTIAIEGTVTPDNDTYLDLPPIETFAGYQSDYKRVKYIVEDNDLWVETSIEEIDGQMKVKATMNGEDPNINWYPTIQTGFYYLNEDEYYMYSEPVEENFEEKDVPILKNVTQDRKGLRFT